MLHLFAGSADLVLVIEIVHLNENMGKLILCIATALTLHCRKVVLNFPIRNPHAIANLALLYPAGNHLVANLLTGLAIGDAFLDQLLLELGQRHIVALGDGCQGFIELVVADAHSGPVRHL